MMDGEMIGHGGPTNATSWSGPGAWGGGGREPSADYVINESKFWNQNTIPRALFTVRIDVSTDVLMNLRTTTDIEYQLNAQCRTGD